MLKYSSSILFLVCFTAVCQGGYYDGAFLGTGQGYGTAEDLNQQLGVDVVEVSTLVDVPGQNNILNATLDFDYGGIWSAEATIDLLVVSDGDQWAAYCYKGCNCAYPTKKCYLSEDFSIGTWSTDALGGVPVDHLTVFTGECDSTACVPEPSAILLVIYALLAFLAGRGFRRILNDTRHI